MRTHLLIFAGIGLFSTLSIFAQPAQGRFKELRNQKRSFIQREAGLSNEDMLVWEELQQSHRKSMRADAPRAENAKTAAARLSQTSIESMTEDQANAILSDRMARAEQAVAARKAVLEAGRKKLGAKKMLRIQLAEKEWKKELLKKIRGTEPEEELD
ncbi:MAG: hypothetical protein ACO3AF_00965 [Flavobacteriales bacterium]|jgi:hypothetical protein|nr:hypothetical protein [Bacteroidota bacterium]